MSLEECRECGGKVSSEAAACPHCGAQVKKVDAGAPGALGMLGMFFGGLIVVGIGWAFVHDDPDAEARQRDRRAIALCWENQEKKSLDPVSARAIAGACEKMERDFFNEYRLRP